MSALKITKDRRHPAHRRDHGGALAEVPDTAKVTTYTYTADFRDPREHSYTDLKLEWT